MAITQVTAPLSVPATNADWTNMTYHLKANRLGLNNSPFILTNDDNTSIPAIAIGSYIQFGDSLYIVDTSDYTIQGTPVDGNNYIRIEPSGTTLIATWIQDKSSYSWNPVNNYYEISASDYALLPYLVVKDGMEYEKYSISMNVSFGKVKATTLNTGHGDNELYAMDQNVRITDSPTFAGLILSGTINTGQGATEVYKQTFQTLSVVATVSTGTRIVALDDMAIGEMRICTCSVRGEGRTAAITTPTGGAYILAGEVNSYLAGGSDIIGNYIDDQVETKIRYFVIWRIS